MATGGEEQVGYSLANVGTVTLENEDETPYYISIVICQEKIVVVDYKDKINIHRLHDGNFIDMLDSESQPRAICLMDATTICVLHDDGLIQMASIKSEDMSPVYTTMKSFCLHGVFDHCHSVVRVNDNIVVVGEKQGQIYLSIVSLDNGHVETIHQICKRSRWSSLTTKDNTIYISCGAGVDDTGVYGFDILNPSQCKYKYEHQRLQMPGSIVINEGGNIFVCNHGDLDNSCIHQLTASCQPVAIFTQGIPEYIPAMFWDHGRLYVTCLGSHDITVFQHVYQGKHKDSEVPTTNGGKKLVIEGTSTQIGQEIPIGQSVEEHLNQARIRMSTEERDLFIQFQNEIGTAIYFSNGPHRLDDGQETLKATETFIEQCRPDMKDKWLDYKSQGKLTPELIDVIYSKERNPELHDKKDKILGQTEALNIIVKARSFDKNGVKEDNYFFVPCMLRLVSPRDVVVPAQDPRLLSTSVLCWVFTETSLPASIFDGLLAACLARWPVAMKKDTSNHLISHSSTVFELRLNHRLTLNFENHIISATVSWSVIDEIKTPNAKLCTSVRMFISRKLSKITNSLKQNLQFDLCVQIEDPQYVIEDSRIRFSPFQIWFEDEIHDPDSPIKPEHMNHARLNVALVTVFGKALREILLDNVPVAYKDIYQAILANQDKLTGGQGRLLLNQEQSKLVFIDARGQKTGTVETFDLSLLYTLIRNVSTVPAPTTGWGSDPQPWDTSLGASVERIRSYRNRISGHSTGAEINHQDFKDYWKKFEDVLHDIEVVINRKVYSTELERQRRQVISIFDAC